jgi:hypothetical protein
MLKIDDPLIVHMLDLVRRGNHADTAARLAGIPACDRAAVLADAGLREQIGEAERQFKAEESLRVGAKRARGPKTRPSGRR